MKEFLEAAAAAIHTWWTHITATAARWGHGLVGLWECLAALPLLFLCMTKRRRLLESANDATEDAGLPEPGAAEIGGMGSAPHAACPEAEAAEICGMDLWSVPHLEAPAGGPCHTSPTKIAPCCMDLRSVPHVEAPTGGPRYKSLPPTAPATPAASQAEPTSDPGLQTPDPVNQSTVEAAMLASPNIINVTAIAAALNMARDTLWDFIASRAELMALVNNSRQTMVGIAEKLLRQAVDHKRAWACTFILEALDQDRFGAFDELPVPSRQANRGRQSPQPGPAETLPELEHIQRLERDGNVAKTLRGSAGKFRFAAQKLGVTPEQLKDYVLLRPELQAEFADRREELLDHAETILSSEIEAMRPWAIRFILLTLGQDRGYVMPQRERRQAPSTPRPRRQVQKPLPVQGPSLPMPADHLQAAQNTEAKLLAGLSAKQRWVVRFLLKHLGGPRGYTEAPPNAGRPVEPRRPTPIGVRDLSRLTPEEREEYLRLCAKRKGLVPAGQVGAVSPVVEVAGLPQPENGTAASSSLNHSASAAATETTSAAGRTPPVAPESPEQGLPTIFTSGSDRDWLKSVDQEIFEMKDGYRKLWGTEPTESKKRNITKPRLIPPKGSQRPPPSGQ